VSNRFSARLSFYFEIVDLELGLEDLTNLNDTLVSSQKSAYIPEVAMMVLSVS